MLKNKLIEQINNENHYTIPKYVLLYAKEAKLDVNSLILLIYLLNQKNKDIFDYKKIVCDLSFDEKELMDAISCLKEKKILTIEMEKNETGILEEKINISSFYDIIFSKFLDESKEKEEENDLYSMFEKEFGRTLSPVEYDIISSWIDKGVEKDLLKEALKEAVFNGSNNLRYIDKLLFEWNKKGIKSASEINKKAKEEVENEEKEETYEYDWLNEN